MKYIIVSFFLLITSWLYSQDSTAIRRIDSLASVYLEMGTTDQLTSIERTLLLEGNKTRSIRFHKKESNIYTLIVQDNDRENVELFFLQNNKPMLVVFFTEGDLNIIDRSLYLIDNKAYMKKGDDFEISDQKFLNSLVENYLSLFAKDLNLK